MADDGLGDINIMGSDNEAIEVESGFIPEVAPDDAPPDTDPLSWVGDDEELRSWASNKGFDAPTKALRSQMEAERQMNKLRSELDQERQMRTANEQYMANMIEQINNGGMPGGQRQQNLTPDDEMQQTIAAAEQAYDQGQIDGQQRGYIISEAIKSYNNARLETMREEIMGSVVQQVAPIADRVSHGAIREAATQMHAQYGPEVSRRAVEVLRERQMPQNDQGIKDAYAIAAGEMYARQRRQQQREQQAETLDFGASGQRGGPSAEDAILEAIFQSGGTMDDGL